MTQKQQLYSKNYVSIFVGSMTAIGYVVNLYMQL